MESIHTVSLFTVLVWNLLLTFTDWQIVATVRMLVQDQVQILHSGQTLEINCEFYMEDFDMFENPIIWKKTQNHEETKINIMSNIVSPFVDTGRFRVTLEQNAPRYRLVLNIIDASLEDYGNYTCEVRGAKTSVLASLTHYIYVKSPVRSIVISDANRTISRTDIDRTLTFTEGQLYPLQCLGYGGCPPPEMRILLGTREISNDFVLDYGSELSGVEGLRLIEHRTRRWTERFEATAEHDGQRLQCIVTVPGLGSNILTAKIRVNYAPVVQCHQVHAYVGDHDVSLRCDVTSRPEIVKLAWIVDDRGANLTESQTWNGYTTSTTQKVANAIETRLYIKETSHQNFRTYIVVAENRIGVTMHQVDLIRKYRSRLSSPIHFVDPQHRPTYQSPETESLRGDESSLSGAASSPHLLHLPSVFSRRGPRTVCDLVCVCVLVVISHKKAVSLLL